MEWKLCNDTPRLFFRCQEIWQFIRKSQVIRLKFSRPWNFVFLSSELWKCVLNRQEPTFRNIPKYHNSDESNILSTLLKVKCKAVPLQACSGPEGSRKLRFPDLMTTAQDGGKVVSLTHRPPLPQEMLLVLISIRGWIDPRAIVRSEGIFVNEKFTDTSWDRTSDLPTCSTAPQPLCYRGPSLATLLSNLNSFFWLQHFLNWNKRIIFL